MQVLSDEPVPPRRLQPKTPRDLETICLKCLEKQPARRYATAADLAADLGRWRRGEPVRAAAVVGVCAGETGAPYRAPLAVAAGMLVLLAAVVTTAFVLLLGAWDQAQKNYETADKNGKALQKSLDSLNEQLSLRAQLCQQKRRRVPAGNLRDSLSWMLRAYEVAPARIPCGRAASAGSSSGAGPSPPRALA